jgi:hypothetical protein
MEPIHDKPRWKTIGQYRNIPLPIKPLPPPVKHFSYAKFFGMNRKSIFPTKQVDGKRKEIHSREIPSTTETNDAQ